MVDCFTRSISSEKDSPTRAFLSDRLLEAHYFIKGAASSSSTSRTAATVSLCTKMEMRTAGGAFSSGGNPPASGTVDKQRRQRALSCATTTPAAGLLRLLYLIINSYESAGPCAAVKGRTLWDSKAICGLRRLQPHRAGKKSRNPLPENP